MSEFEDFNKALDKLGEDEVRAKLSQDLWANKRKKWASDWLTRKEAQRTEKKGAAALSLAEEGNQIAKGNLDAVRSAKNAAWVAAIAAIVAALFAAITYLQSKP